MRCYKYGKSLTFFVLSRYFTGIREKNQSFLVISSRVETNPRQVSQVFQRALAVFTDLQTLEGLDQFEHDFLGKQGEVTLLRKGLKNLSPEEKQQAGPEIQKAFEDLSAKVAEFRSQHEAKACVAQMEQEWIDVTKSLPFSRGALHPLSQIQRRVEQIFTSMGFDIADGPEVETEWYNFDALNIPGDHPARDMQDTFWISHDSNDSQKNTVLRTQTSNVQIRWMEQYGAPLRMIAPGRVYRNEDVDMTHDATFYQVEGMMVDKGISLAHLKGAIGTMLSELFEKEIKIRIRPGYFPFVEPGLEIDIWFEFIDKNGNERAMWLEFMGAGMTHPEVLKNGGIDPEVYSGFAFGFGLTRLAMMKYSIDDIRLLSSAKKDFLQQF